MGLLQIARTYRSLARLRHILAILAKHGFGELIDRLNLSHYVPGFKHRTGVQEGEEQLTRGEQLARRMRRALEELGPTFVKLGQMLAGRPDLMPEAFLVELGRLHEHVTPFPFDMVRKCVESELGGTLEETFDAFEEECIASGSIAQVHRATTVDGQRVVVKVKRPGIEKMVMTDVDLMTQFAKILEKRVPEVRVLRPMLIVEEFARGIKRELDFIGEASVTQRFAEVFAENPRVRIPGVFWEYTTSDVLTLERIEGTSLANAAGLEALHVDPRRLAARIVDAFMEQVFVHGFFHADPHPGNIFVIDDDVIALLDFGLVGRLTEEMRGDLATLMIAVTSGDIETIIDTYVETGVFVDGEDDHELRSDLRELLDRYYGMPLRHISTRRLFLELMETARRHEAVLPREYVLMGRAFTEVEGIARGLDPDFNVREVAEPYARRLLMERFSPKRVARRTFRMFMETAQALRRAPRQISTVLRRLASGRLGIQIEHTGIDNFALELDRASNRLSFSIIVAALIVGSSLVLANDVGPKYGPFPVIGIVGYCAAAVLGLWLLLAILRRGRL